MDPGEFRHPLSPDGQGNLNIQIKRLYENQHVLLTEAPSLFSIGPQRGKDG